MADQTAFFTFGTNAEEVAAQIATAMAAIQASVSKDVGTPNFEQTVGRDVAGLGQLFERSKADMERHVGSINNLLSQVGTGKINVDEFKGKYRALVSDAVGGIPRIMADELAHAPEATALRTNIQGVGATLANDYVRYFEQALQKNRGIGGAALRGMRISGSGGLADASNFVGDIMGVVNRPAAFGNESSAYANLINRVRAERELAKDPLGMSPIQPPPGIAEYVQQMRQLAEMEGRIFLGPQGGVHFVPSNAASELSELVNRMRAAEGAARRMGREFAVTEAQARQLAIAEELLANGAQQVGSRLIDPKTGQPFRLTSYGATEEQNPIRGENAVQAAARLRAEAQNSVDLAQNFRQVQDVAGYQVMGDRVFKKTSAGHAEITPLSNAYEYLRVMEATDVAEKKRITNAQRLNELNGKKVARSEAGQSGVLGGFLNRFNRGEQSVLTGLGGQAASATAFTLAYGSIFALQHAVTDTISEFKDFQDSYTDLQVATRGTDAVTNDFVNTLGGLARISGSNVGASLDTAARAIRAFGDPQGSTKQQMQDIGIAATDAATKLALIANKSLPDATGDVISIGTAYGLQPDQFSQIDDAIANAKRTLGGDPTQIAQGLSLISQAATEAGYSLNEAAAMISLVQARTDESGQAIATRLGRVFQIVNGSTGKTLAAELGVDPNQSVKDQLADYAKIYSDPNTTKATQDRIASSLGGTANLRELLPLLKEGSRLQAAFAEAIKNTGAAEAEFGRKSDNLVGVLLKVKGDISAIQVDIARSGIGAPLGAMVKVLEPVLHSVDRLLKLWDLMPTPLKDVLGVLIDIAAVSKTISVLQAKNAVVGGLSAAAGAGEAAAGAAAGTGISSGLKRFFAGQAERSAATTAVVEVVGNAVVGGAEQATGTQPTESGGGGESTTAIASNIGQEEGFRVVYERAFEKAAEAKAAQGAGAFAGIRGGLGVLGRGLVSPVGLGVAAVTAGLYGYDKIMTGKDQRDSFQRTADQTGAAYGRIDGSAKSLSQAATDLNAAAGKIDKADANGLAKSTQQALADALKEQAKALTDLAKAVTTEEAKNAANADKGVFGSGAVESVDSLEGGLNQLALSGQTAVVSMKMLRQVLNTETPVQGATRFEPNAFAGNLIGAAFGQLQGSLPSTTTVNSGRYIQHAVTDPVTGVTSYERTPVGVHRSAADAAEQIRSNVDIPKLTQDILDKAAKMGIKEGQPYTQAQVDKLTQYAVNKINLGGVLLHGAREVKKGFLAHVLDAMILPQPEDKELLNGQSPLSRDKIIEMLHPKADASGNVTWQGMPAHFQTELDQISPFDTGGKRLSILKAQMDWYKTQQRRNTGPDISELDLDEQKAEDAYVQAKVADLERLRKVAQGRKGLSRAQIRAIGHKYLRQEITQAGDDTSQVVAIMESADRQALAAVEAELKTAAKLAREARIKRLEMLNPNRYRQPGDLGIDLGSHLPDGGGTLSPAEKIYNDFEAAKGKAGPVPNKGSGYSTGDDSGSGRKSAKDRAQSAADRYEAMQNAQAAETGGQMAQDRAALNTARYHLEHAKEGSTKWYQAQAELANAQRAYSADARNVGVSAAGANAARLGGGIAEARYQIQEAQAGLKEYAKGTAEYNEQLANLFTAQRAMRDAVVQFRINQFKLRGDITDPVENARDELRGALLQLHSDAGSGADVIAADKVAVREGRQSLLSEKFNQRLQDVQTAEQLGKISHEAYIRYLEHEHDRLSAVKHRTRQQTDELNQIDTALKDAVDSMDGQFNLGDVNVNGLVYQMRRFNAEQRAQNGGGDPRGPYQNGGRPVVNQTVHIAVNGADTAKVRSVLTSILGEDVSQRRTLRNRKV